jgi:hypothetical protein
MEKPAREFITAGRSEERVPAHSPIPDLLIAALNGGADAYKHGVISSLEIHAFLLDRVVQMRDISLTPQVGRLPNPAFAEGTFLFRVPNSTVQNTPDEDESTSVYSASEQALLKWLWETNDNLKVEAITRAILGHQGGLVKNDREAARLKLAADQGNVIAQFDLGVLYEEGRGGLTKNDRDAARLYKLAADRGHATAQSKLGVLYEEGRGGLTKNDREAARLYKLAADQGDFWGLSHLADFYRRGAGGVPKNFEEAMRLRGLAETN